MFRVIVRGFQYFVVNSQGVACAGPYGTRIEAQQAADRLTRGRGY
jgi:hypothetical protein